MPDECLKARERRLRDPNFATHYFVGHGLDVGGGSDGLGSQQWPGMLSCRTWDMPDGDAQFLESVPAAAYDFVHSSHCLEHMVDPTEALAHWVRVCKPGGYITVLVPDEDMYEQGVFPSTFNPDHRSTFTPSRKASGWSPASVAITDLVDGLHGAVELVRLSYLDEGYPWTDERADQTQQAAECAIELVLRKRHASELRHGGRVFRARVPNATELSHADHERRDASYREAVELHRMGRYQEALTIYHALDAEEPHHDAQVAAAMLLREARQPEQAIALLHEAVALCPTSSDALANLAVCYEETGQSDAARYWFGHAIAANPGNASAHVGFGMAELARGDVDAALQSFSAGVALPPRTPTDESNQAAALMLLGRWREGWERREALWHTVAQQTRQGAPPHAGPRWTGQGISGRHLLVYAVHGHGDTIHMMRYMNMVRDWSNARITWQVHEGLIPVVQRHALPGETVVSKSAEAPIADASVPFMSLPFVFGTDQHSVPTSEGYLYQPYPGRLPVLCAERHRIGLLWAGFAGHANDANRSATVEVFAPLVREFPDFWWSSFQVGPRADEAAAIGLDPFHPTDFHETAERLKRIDLLITVDTATAHLAGAIGIPTWLCIPAVPDMRWPVRGESTPWYDSMRIFRQPTLGDWRSVVFELHKALEGIGQ